MFKAGKYTVPSTVSSEALPVVLIFWKLRCLNVPFLHPLNLRLLRIWMSLHQKKVVSSGFYLSFTCLISNCRHPGASCLAVWVSCLPVQMSEVSWCICNGSGSLCLHSHSCSLDVFSCWTGAYLSGDEQPCCSTGNGRKVYDMSDVSALCIQKIPFVPQFMRGISKCVKKKTLMFQRCKCIQHRLDLFSWHGKLVRNSVILREHGCFHRQRISINHRCAAVKQCGASSYILTVTKSSPVLLWPSKVLVFFSDQFKYSLFMHTN